VKLEFEDLEFYKQNVTDIIEYVHNLTYFYLYRNQLWIRPWSCWRSSLKEKKTRQIQSNCRSCPTRM